MIIGMYLPDAATPQETQKILLRNFLMIELDNV